MSSFIHAFIHALILPSSACSAAHKHRAITIYAHGDVSYFWQARRLWFAGTGPERLCAHVEIECQPHPALGTLSWNAWLQLGLLREPMCAARGPSQAAEQHEPHPSSTMARIQAATAARSREHFAREGNQATFLSLRPLVSC